MTFKQILHRLNRRDTRLLPKFNKPIKLLFFVIFISGTIFWSQKIFAQENITIDTSQAVQKYKDKQKAIEKGNNQESWINESLASNAIAINQAIGGTLSDDVLSGKTAWIPQGMIGFTNKAIVALYTPPASGVEYIAQSVNNFLGKPVYAKDTGYNSLYGIQSLWKTLRNATYVVISIVFVVIGIMIMLRIKISPQAVINIQNAIPKLITTLILVTFSYAIAGLLIDLSYVFQGISLSLLFQSKGGLSSKLFSGIGYNPSFSELNSLNFGGFFAFLWKLAPVTWLIALAAIPSLILGFLPVAGWAIGGVTFIVIITIIFIFILIQVVKFFFGIAKCYLNVIIRIILGPLEIGLGAIPGSKLGFSSWLIEVIANLAVFPISVIFLTLSTMILDVVTENGLSWSPSIFSGGGILGGVLGLTILMVFAKLPSLVPEFIFKIKPSPFGKAIGESFKPIGAITGKSAKLGATAGASYGVNYLANHRGTETGLVNGEPAEVPSPDSKSRRAVRASAQFVNDYIFQKKR